MGNAMCRQRIQQQNVPPPGYPDPHNTSAPPITYHTSSYPPDVRLEGYPRVHFPTNGQSHMTMPTDADNQSPPVTQQKVTAIRNDVNVNKASVHLERDEDNPGHYLVAFTFDAVVSGSISIFFHAKEGPDFSLIPVNQHLFQPVSVPFEKGLAQKFVQPAGTGVNLSAFEPSDLVQVKDEVYPLVLRAETASNSDKEIGAPLPKHVGAQTTNCVLEIKDGEYCVKVVKQIIWVGGTRYELQEIYGIESVDGGISSNTGEFGKECVICLSEPRDTTVLPCRHMCLCSGCADLLRQPNHSNRCPICRTPIKRLLAIDVCNGELAPI